MKRINILMIVLCACLISTGWTQNITGSGTANTIPQFTSSTSIGDSPIVQSNGNIGIGTNNPQAKFEVFDPNGNNSNPYGLYGLSLCPISNFCGAIRGDTYNYGTGVIGISFGEESLGGGGVLGITFQNTGFTYGARGDSFGTTGFGVGLFSQVFSPDGVGALLINRAGGNILLGQVGPEGSERSVFRVDGKGRVYANGGFRPHGADFAESMPVKGDHSLYEPGDLLVIDRTGNRRLAVADAAYSTLVAGIYSTKPGVLASPYAMDDPNLVKEVPMAVVGIVPCKVSAENGAIEVGDLLVASSTPGHAMKGTDRSRMLGAVVGKALDPLQKGTGVIQVLVTLQ